MRELFALKEKEQINLVQALLGSHGGCSSRILTLLLDDMVLNPQVFEMILPSVSDDELSKRMDTFGAAQKELVDKEMKMRVITKEIF